MYSLALKWIIHYQKNHRNDKYILRYTIDDNNKTIVQLLHAYNKHIVVINNALSITMYPLVNVDNVFWNCFYHYWNDDFKSAYKHGLTVGQAYDYYYLVNSILHSEILFNDKISINAKKNLCCLIRDLMLNYNNFECSDFSGHNDWYELMLMSISSYLTEDDIISLKIWKHLLEDYNFENVNYFNKFKSFTLNQRLVGILYKRLTHCSSRFLANMLTVYDILQSNKCLSESQNQHLKKYFARLALKFLSEERK